MTPSKKITRTFNVEDRHLERLERIEASFGWNRSRVTRELYDRHLDELERELTEKAKVAIAVGEGRHAFAKGS